MSDATGEFVAAAIALHDRISEKNDRTARLRASVLRQTKNLSRLVDDLLDVSRLTRGRIPLKKEPADLASIVPNVAAGCQPLLDSRQQRLSITGYGQPQDRARALEAGFDLHIVKPLQIEQLTAVVSGRELRVSA
jgi:signal transduction histidine kinase